MRRIPLVLGLPPFVVFGLATSASAAEFDAQGVFSFGPDAVVAESFESYTPSDTGGASSAQAVENGAAIEGTHVLRVTLLDDAFAVPLALPTEKGSYRLSFWIRQDCVSGVAVDYDDATTPSYAHAFPTGRMTSDGWVEMQTAPFLADGTAQGVDARLFLRSYDASMAASVDIDGVEVVRDGAFAERASCAGLDLHGACSAEELCLGGVCRDARGWFPPLPSEEDREQFVASWRRRIHDTYGPYTPRKLALPSALEALDHASQATTGVQFWSTLAETIRRLSDAHTYFRASFQKALPTERPLNACFFEGDADLTHEAWPSDPTYHDILVSHTGPDHQWGLRQGDRLVAVDGSHPIAWARTLIGKSFGFWESDDPAELAGIATQLRSLIPLHARTLTVLHCDAATGACDPSPEVIDVASITALAPGESVSLVGCDNRPFYHVPGGPEDHLLGLGIDDAPEVLEGRLFESSPAENLRGGVWNTLYGGWPGAPLDALLRSAVTVWQSAGGVVEDHREGHGGTSQTASILVDFSRPRFTALASMMRSSADDEGPMSPEEGKQLFDKIKGYAGLQAGSPDARTDIPVALLLTWDVSASDFLPYMMKGGPKVRLFGPGPTMGAFGTFFQYSYWGGLLWSISAEDSISPEGMTLTGRGVVPDEIVLPRQSDLLQGKDTIHDAAVAWIRSEVTP